MKVTEALSLFLDACLRNGVEPGTVDREMLAPAAVITAAPAHWRELAFAAKTAAMRWCGLWAQERNGGFEAFSCFEWGGAYLVVRSAFGRDDTLSSLASIYPNADRPERHAHDLLGVRFSDQPDARRWTRHRAWNEHEYPLRSDFKAIPGRPTPPDHEYPFAQAHGPGIVEIPVGPVHAGIIEPGHFRFQAMGEIILNLEEHLGYVHKGVEKIAVGRDAHGLARLAGRVSGDTTVAHAWAACQAMERAGQVEPTPRSLYLRAVLSERERIANHLGDVGAICNDAAFAFAFYQLMRLKENWVRENSAIFGHRLLMDSVAPGGVSADVTPEQTASMIEQARALSREAAEIVGILENSESLEDRLMRTGRIEPDLASQLGLTGYMGKASGQTFDVRADAPYAPYDRLEVRVPHYRAVDVAARAKVRAEEIGISCDLIVRLLEALPEGPICASWRSPARACEGLGIVEGWRGEIITYVRFDDSGRIARFFPRDPSWLAWPALELCVQGNIVPDFPLCNKSVNGSYSGHDL